MAKKKMNKTIFSNPGTGNKSMSIYRQILAVLLCATAIWPAIASAWWNDDWSYRVPVHMDTSITGAAIATTQTEVPVLIKLHTGNFQDFFLLKEDLSDLRFIGADDKTPLKFHVEAFDLVNQLMFVWVKVPQITGSLNTEKFWMYYGNDQAVAASDANATYDVNTVMVHHFQPGIHMLSDETAYANNIAASNGIEEPAALISGGMRFNGEGSATLPASASTRLVPANGMTVSFWVKSEDNAPAVLYSHSDGEHEIRIVRNEGVLTAHLVSASGGEYATQAVNGFIPGAWHHVAVTVNQNGLSLYLNGTAGGTIEAPMPEIGGQINFAADGNGNLPLTGVMDEIQFSNTVRSPDYIMLAARNQGMENKLLHLGESEQLGNAGGGESHFGFVLKKLTFDAKVVIVFLIVMSIISWLVMIMKGMYLSRISKDNKRFLAAYYALGNADPAQLDQAESEDEKELDDSPVAQALFGSHDHFQSSPIYHMYHRGLNEVRMRVGNAVSAQAAAMTEQSAEAIRATMDADMVRELQKINSKMVLLTIAISGGPFIGLLGTVIGVMITFAEMASTGDVNIASIAPGMAAALMATVAGLWVAIPALFGYNYLGSRIRDITADMRVFTNEFVTRVAEYYG
jgi:biopolymer transport protein ExbB